MLLFGGMGGEKGEKKVASIMFFCFCEEKPSILQWNLKYWEFAEILKPILTVEREQSSPIMIEATNWRK